VLSTTTTTMMTMIGLMMIHLPPLTQHYPLVRVTVVDQLATAVASGERENDNDSDRDSVTLSLLSTLSTMSYLTPSPSNLRSSNPFIPHFTIISASSSRSISNEAFQDAFADNNNNNASSSSVKSNKGMQLNTTTSNAASTTTATTAYQRTTSMNSVASAGSAGSKGSGTATAGTASKTAAAPSGEDFFANFGV